MLLYVNVCHYNDTASSMFVTTMSQRALGEITLLPSLNKAYTYMYNLRSNRNVCLNHCRTKKYGLDSLSYHGAQLWNLLTNDMKECKDLDIFKASVRNWNEPMCKCHMCVH